MKLQKLQNIAKVKKDVPLYYRNDFTADGIFTHPDGKDVSVPFVFTLETLPTGEKQIDIQLKQNIDYPLLPVLKALKQEILILDRKGVLHC